MIDPDTKDIEKVCKSLIGAKIHINYTITLKNGDINTGIINNCNIVGNYMENILLPLLKNQITTINEGPKQKSPDFYNRNYLYEYELKCFHMNPNFDISNYISYIYQLDKDLIRKLYRTQYLIFKYSLKKKYIIIDDFKLCNVSNLISYTGKYPISLQNKNGMWYNIRPCSFNNIYNKTNNYALFIQKICESILICPNKIDNKREIIYNIQKQYHQICFNQTLNLLNELQIN
jgi:hypothetical protein